MISEYGIREVHRLVLLPVNYAGIYLGMSDRAVPQQFRHGVQVRPEGEHHRRETVAARMEQNRKSNLQWIDYAKT